MNVAVLYLRNILLFFLLNVTTIFSQDTTSAKALNTTDTIEFKKDVNFFSLSKFILPTTLFAYGAIKYKRSIAQKIDTETNNFSKENFKTATKLADYLQYAPLATTFSLNLAGVKSRHSFGNLFLLASMSSLINVSLTHGIKTLSRRIRPDSSEHNSFPSGHTATAFAGAELLNIEYGNRSSFYPIAGYVVASATGFLRIYNHRHWASDVIAGAGIGIASARLAYLLYPSVKKLFPSKKRKFSIIPTPYYNGYSTGLQTVVLF